MIDDIIGFFVIGLAALIVIVNVAITLSPRFRRWVYSKDEK